jgi:IclR family acetate operon transcriptional repressor
MTFNMVKQEKLGDGVRAVDRALDILMAFTATDYELSASDLLKRVDLSRPTLYRLLNTLEQNGFLTTSGEPKQFKLGPSVAHLSHVWNASLDLPTIAQPFMRRIWEHTGETVALFVPQLAQRLCIAEIPSVQPLSFKRGVGYREHISRGASGRAILAFLQISDEQLKEYINGSSVELDKIIRELKITRQRGYATSKDELIEGAVAVAVPFFNGAGEIAGSIGVFGPTVRVDDKKVHEFAELLKSESQSLSKALGRP